LRPGRFAARIRDAAQGKNTLTSGKDLLNRQVIIADTGLPDGELPATTGLRGTTDN
jgi:hypothetical protein